ncbi:glutamine hydrolyzing CTP synthase [Candidatus Nanohalovita haloferacivicina]|uniref:glutamine hydrolyzing CTP synthase n=1 Tax=Candidatus Nanohalovita haloferacivicina TaxID=2978046 RepID=UPI00325FA761|nr:CTP synthase [Candidatus Nanohalobia archaeon BNXNv]
MPKWIFVTGGVLSGLGKGLVSASVSKLLQQRELEITPIKCDGYLNVDPGTMNPHEHGEVFVLEDGTEVDMDFGHYERFLGIKTAGKQNLTSGKVFKQVIEKEREGEYLGKTVQMVPHVTNRMKKLMREAGEEKNSDINIVEIGGTVGDLENQVFLEAVRQLRSELPEEDTYLIHTTLVPYLDTVGEQKTKPTQHSVKELQSLGLEPDMIVGRSQNELDQDVQEKIALFCDVEEKEVISDPDLDYIYQLPLELDKQNVDKLIAEKMGLPERKNGMKDWKARTENLEKDTVSSIAICGKYTDIDDSYASVEEALKHAGAEIGGQVNIEYIDTENFNEESLQGHDGVIIPGGFGSRGVEGKIDAIQYCRENNIPLLGLCYGLQLMTIEFARNVLGIENAVSEEFAESEDQELVVAEMPGQKNIEEMGGTMRLGSYTANITGQVSKIYGSDTATERHRHRYELNPEYHEKLEANGLKISGTMQNGKLAEYIELPENNFFIGTQAHPEFTSTFQKPNPLYLAFLKSTV